MIDFDIESVKKAGADLPQLVSSQSQAAVDEAAKNAELSKLTAVQSCAAQTSRLSQELDRCPEIYLSTPVVRGETVSLANGERQE